MNAGKRKKQTFSNDLKAKKMDSKTTCKTCKFWNTDRPEFDRPCSKGWGYCTNEKIATPMHLTAHRTNNEANPKRNSIISSDYKGFLTKELKEAEIFGVFQTGENFGCVHHKNKPT